MSGDRRVDVPVAPPHGDRRPDRASATRSGAGCSSACVRGYPWEVTGRIGALAATYCLEQVGTMNHRYTVPEFVARYREVFGDAPELRRYAEIEEAGLPEHPIFNLNYHRRYLFQ